MLLRKQMSNARNVVRDLWVMYCVNSHLLLNGCWRSWSRKRNSLVGSKHLQKAKNPNMDELMANFFKTYWSCMGVDFTTMVNRSLTRGWYPWGVTWGLTALLFKEGHRLRLTNWRPITLLNTTYKIFAKALQRRLQPLLVEVIDSGQIAFLPLWSILNNILLTHGSIQWAMESNQDSIFLKLDFSKAYDSVDWSFMFLVMKKLGMPHSFTNTIRMLFQDVTVFVNINNQATKLFELHKGVQQGCMLASYLFILVVEALKIAIKKTVSIGRLKGIVLPWSNSQQIISQYLDDTSFIGRIEEYSVNNLVKICIRCWCHPFGTSLRYGLDLRKFWESLRLCCVTTCGPYMRTQSEHE